MDRKGWYLVAYDISDDRRLARIHRVLKKNGIAAQKSVFFVRGTESWVNSLLNQVADRMKLNEDDLRAYPIIHPSQVWAFGPNPLADFPIVDFDSEKKTETKPKGWRRFFKIFSRV